MKNVQVLKQESLLGKNFSIYGDWENPLFRAKDVAEWINHSNPSKMISDSDLSENEMIKLRIGTLTNSYSALFLTEEGLYEVLMQSRKPIARQFKKGVKEILKSIRKTGGYIVERSGENDADLLARALLVAGKRIRQQEEHICVLEKQSCLDKPKIQYYDRMMQSKNTYTSTLIAKELGVGDAKELHLRLKAMEILFKQSGQWTLKAKYGDKGYAESKIYSFTNKSTGTEGTVTYTVWTEKGREFLHEVFEKTNLL